MRGWLGRVTDRVAGRSVSPDLAAAVVQWSRTATQLNKLIGSGSVISAEERSVVLVALQLHDSAFSGGVTVRL